METTAPGRAHATSPVGRTLMGCSAAGLVIVLATAGCSAPDPAPVRGAFEPGGSADPTCLDHQRHDPGPAHAGTDGTADTAQVLTVLRYYTTNGRKPFCDGRPPTDRDRRWAELYVTLGADRGNVAPILDGAPR